MRFYKNNVSPLQEVPLGDLLDGRIYVNEEGIRMWYCESESELEVIQSSALNLGERMEDLTPVQLELYWKLMNNKYDSDNTRT